MLGTDTGEFSTGRRAYDGRLVAIEQRIYELAQSVSSLETAIAAAQKILSGNGQPGVIQDFSAYKGKMGERVTNLERAKWWLSGALFISWAAFLVYLKWFASQ